MPHPMPLTLPHTHTHTASCVFPSGMPPPPPHPPHLHLRPTPQGFLALKDALVCLYERGEVAAIKPHPAQSEWHRAAEYALQPLIEVSACARRYNHTHGAGFIC